jgi:hypothetical protein
MMCCLSLQFDSGWIRAMKQNLKNGIACTATCATAWEN